MFEQKNKLITLQTHIASMTIYVLGTIVKMYFFKNVTPKRITKFKPIYDKKSILFLFFNFHQKNFKTNVVIYERKKKKITQRL